MIDALFSGISGLNAFQNGLNTESNNLSNTNTIGYKADQISFADMMYQDGVGKGVKVQTIDKSFAQGTFKVTGNNLDMAIDGNGFFILQGDSGENFYSRAGNFRIGVDGTLQNPDGYVVQGITTTQADVFSSNPDVDRVTNEYVTTLASTIITSPDGSIITTFNSFATDYEYNAKDDPLELSGQGYKTRETKLADISLLKTSLNSALSNYADDAIDGTSPTNQTATVTLSPDIFTTELDELTMTIDGVTISQTYETSAQNTLNKFADKISAVAGLSASVDENGNLVITNLNPGDNRTISDTISLNSPNGDKTFLLDITEAQSGSGYQKVLAVEQALSNAIVRANSNYLRLSNNVDTTSNTTSDIQMMLDNLGFSNDPFGTPELNDGILYVNQNGARFAVAKVSTVIFNDQLSLEPQGDNLFSKTLDSGEPVLATNQNKVIGATLELSNSDLGKGLVNLMVYQRAFEASSKSITTSDEFLKTAIELKR